MEIVKLVVRLIAGGGCPHMNLAKQLERRRRSGRPALAYRSPAQNMSGNVSALEQTAGFLPGKVV